MNSSLFSSESWNIILDLFRASGASVTSVTSDNKDTLTSHCPMFGGHNSQKSIPCFLSQWDSHYLHKQTLLISLGLSGSLGLRSGKHVYRCFMAQMRINVSLRTNELLVCAITLLDACRSCLLSDKCPTQKSNISSSPVRYHFGIWGAHIYKSFFFLGKIILVLKDIIAQCFFPWSP